jgi:tellurite resistance protein TerC
METLSQFLMDEWLGKAIWLWLMFVGIVVVLLAFDLGVLHRKDHQIGVKESLGLSAFYLLFAIAFGGFVWFKQGAEAGANYYTAMLVEKTLAMDNIFIISLIFTYLSIPLKYQHRVLFWGILGVILLRGLMIGLGATLIAEFSWILYIFGAFLIVTGIKMLIMVDHEPDIANNRVLKFLKKHFRFTETIEGQRFFIKKPHPKTGKIVTYATPLLLALICIEVVDLVFAVDSVPAVFAITHDPYIVYTSNIFAILGLRALYFALGAIIHRFSYLKYSLAVVLIFIGGKIFAADIFGIEKVPAWISLSVTIVLLGSGVVFSLFKNRRETGGKSS